MGVVQARHDPPFAVYCPDGHMVHASLLKAPPATAMVPFGQLTDEEARE